jgi:hypothetical protein
MRPLNAVGIPRLQAWEDVNNVNTQHSRIAIAHEDAL